MIPLLLLAAALLPAPARAADDGVVSRIVRSLGDEVDLFADCDRSKRKPLLLAASGGTVRQIALKCRDGGGTYDVYLSYQSKAGEPKKDFLKEAFFRATNPEAEARLRTLADSLAESGGEQELAFIKYRSAEAVVDLTVSLGSFTWDLLSGATYAERLKNLSERQPSVDVSDFVELKVPGQGRVQASITTFAPGWSLVHLLAADGGARRVAARLPVGPNGERAHISAFPVHADESVLKVSTGTDSTFLRVDPSLGKLGRLSLVERATFVKDLETRFALIPAASVPGSYYEFDLVRVEIRRDAQGSALSSKEKVLGRCAYDAAKQDFSCPKI